MMIRVCGVWPEELDETRILVCKLNVNGCLEHFTLFQPTLGDEVKNIYDWTGKDIMLANQFGHFTLLTWEDDGAFKSHSIISELLEAAHRCSGTVSFVLCLTFGNEITLKASFALAL
jgi:hypothetical protein